MCDVSRSSRFTPFVVVGGGGIFFLVFFFTILTYSESFSSVAYYD